MRVVRRNYLAPLTRMPREADRLVVRELELTGTAPLAGFRGEQTNGSLLAARYGLRVAPAVVMLDREGKLAGRRRCSAATSPACTAHTWTGPWTKRAPNWRAPLRCARSIPNPDFFKREPA